MMPMPQILNRPKFRSSSCGWPEALISLVSRVSIVDLVVESDDCSAATTNFSMFQTAVSTIALAWIAELARVWYVWTTVNKMSSLFTRNEKEHGVKSIEFLCWWDFSNASRTRLAYQLKLVCEELAFAFTFCYLIDLCIATSYRISEEERSEVEK